MQPPNDIRPFVHKRIGRGLKSFVTSGFNPLSAAGGFLSEGARPRPRPRIALPRAVQTRASRPTPVVVAAAAARPSIFTQAQKELGRRLKSQFGVSEGRERFAKILAGGSECPPLMKRDPVDGRCKFFLGDRPGPDTRPLEIGPGTPVGDAVMGRYGAGLEPGSQIVDRAVCLRGMVLGNDGVCYNRSQIRNTERMWPKGRRPLLTGGDMRAISTAARAGRRLEGATKRLQKIGLMKKPPPRRKAVSGPTHHHT